MGKRPATMVRELPLVSSVEQRQVVHGAQHAAMSPFPYMIIMTCHEMRLWEGHGNMGTKREWHGNKNNYDAPWNNYGNNIIIIKTWCEHHVHQYEQHQNIMFNIMRSSREPMGTSWWCRWKQGVPIMPNRFSSRFSSDSHNENQLTLLNVRTQLKTDPRFSYDREPVMKAGSNVYIHIYILGTGQVLS